MPKPNEPQREFPVGEGEELESPVKQEFLVPAQIVSESTLVEFIERRSKLLELALPVALKVTQAHEWVDFGGNPWPTISACLKIMRRFGINMNNNHHWRDEREDEKGKFYIYYWEADFCLGSQDVYPEIGSTTSRDSFFAMRDKVLRPMSEVPEDSILKAARANCIVRGVTGVLGIRGITWADLNKLGIQRVGSARVSFKDNKPKTDAPTKTETKGKKPASEGEEKTAPRAAGDFVPDEERKEVIAKFLGLADFLKDIVPPDELCELYLSYAEGKKDADGNTFCPIDRVPNFKRVSAINWLRQAIKKIEEDYDTSGFSVEGGDNAPDTD